MALVIYAVAAIILKKQDPIKTLSWVIVLILLPYIGIILYLFIGRNFRQKKIYSRKGASDVKYKQEISAQQTEVLRNNPGLWENNESFKKIIFQNLKSSYSTIDYNSDINFYFVGTTALDAMYNSISTATQYIHLQSYIFEEDNTGKRFKKLLIAKAKSGVEVRLIFDGAGSFSLKKATIKEMENAGIEVIIFAKIHLLMPSFLINYRNHRKILIVDGKTGFLGGVNIADRYYYGTTDGDWHDTHIQITGDSVSSLQSSFLLDRWFIKNRKIKKRKKYFPIPEESKEFPNNIPDNKYITQIISSGPDSDWASIMQCYFSAITLATEHIYIITPYFTPSETILNAIKIAALGGIDVRVMIPEHSDAKIVHWGTMSYVSELLDAGVKIYLFQNGFNHSKVISIDGQMCIVGSANMDCRSFEHNFEIMSVIYNVDCAKKIENEFTSQLDHCRKVNIAKWRKRSTVNKIKESIARLCSPLL